MINLKLNKATTILPQQILKGSQKSRTKTATKMTKELFDDIKGGYAYGDMSPNILVQIIKKHIPENIRTKIEKNPGDTKGRFSLFISGNGTTNGYLITLPVNSKTKKVSKLTIGSIMQAMSEFFDRICHPKYNPRGIKYINKLNKNPKSYQQLEQIYTIKHLSEKDLRKLIKDLSTEDQIDILQLMRYNLSIKLKALKQGEKYQKEIEKLYRHKNMAKAEPLKYREQNIPQKIEIIENILADIIKKERSKLAK